MAYYLNLPLITALTLGQQSALNEPLAIAVTGGPGTGKSVVAVWRHVRNYGLGKTSLLLTYTKTLERYLSLACGDQNVDAASNVARTYFWTNHQMQPYDEIIIDEAQDVEKDRYVTIQAYAQIVSYGADDQQSLWPERLTTENELEELFPNNKRYSLDENFRNTYEIMRFVRCVFPNRRIRQHLMDTLVQKGRTGPKPYVIIVGRDEAKEDAAVLEIISQFGSDTHNIAILVPFRRNVDRYSEMLTKANVVHSWYYSDGDEEVKDIQNVHVTPFRSCKGVEFDTVVIPNFSRMKWYIDNNEIPVSENDYYVALTRAKRNLYLISDRELPQIAVDTYQKEVK